METCKRLQINLRKYLNDVLPKLPSWPINNVAALSPVELEILRVGSPDIRRPYSAGLSPA